MKIKLAFGFIPYLQLNRTNGSLGSSKIFLVWLRHDADYSTVAHEEVHVAFWYGMTALCTAILYLAGLPLYYAFMLSVPVDPLLNTFSESYTRFDESFAYARGATYKADTEAYLSRIDKSTLHLDKYGKGFVDKARKRMRWWGE